MPSVDQTIRLYEELAEVYERQGQAKLRDWFLVLAADAALSAGRRDEAERFRARLLQINPHHLLKPFASMADALKSPDVQGYIVELRRAYPPQAAEQLLESQKASGAPAPPRAPAPRPQPAEKRAPVAPEPVPAPAEEPPLKVYRVQNMPEESPSPARQPAKPLSSWEPAVPPAKAAAPAKMVPPAPLAAPAPRPRQTFPASPHPSVPLPTRRPDDLDSLQGRWVSSFLFGLVLLFALLLAGYCFARPFLPAAWIPF
jgi:hypothetical protein